MVSCGRLTDVSEDTDHTPMPPVNSKYVYQNHTELNIKSMTEMILPPLHFDYIQPQDQFWTFVIFVLPIITFTLQEAVVGNGTCWSEISEHAY